MTDQPIRLQLPSGSYRSVPLGEALAGAHDLIQRGRPELGEAICHQVLDSIPDQFDATMLLGIALLKQKRIDKALSTLQHACTIDPGNADAWNNLGYAALEAKQFDNALMACDKAIALEPELAPAHNNRGTALIGSGQIQQAIAAYRKALKQAPDYAAAHSNLAAALQRTGDHDTASEHAQRAIALNPTDPDALLQLASVHDARQRIEDAIAVYRSAIALAPERSDLHHNLALLLERQGDWLAAVESHQQALKLDPDNAPALSNLVYLKRNLCLWDEYEQDQARFDAGIQRGLRGLAPLTYLAMLDDPARQQACARLWASHLQTGVGPADNPVTVTAGQDQPIRLGYLSADYHEHPTARLMAGLFEQHDHQRFHLTAYSIGRDDGSALRQRVIDAFDEFRDVRELSDAQVIEQIRADQIDILVDLKGYTGEARSEIMAARPAPIQVQYLGYPGTMGAGFIDYAIVDEFCVPQSESSHFDEKLIRLPYSYQVNDSQRETPSSTPTREQCGLADGSVVYCCFSKPFKITPQLFASWCEILLAVPESVLWLMAPRPGLGIEQRLIAQAANHGLESERLIFANRRPYVDYLALYANADLFLDTTPYSAHTMTTDALWMGCPVLALEGASMAARVAAGLVNASGMPDLITRSFDEYRDRAIELGRNPDKLARLRSTLSLQRQDNPLFDTARFARALESALEKAHASHQQDLPVSDIEEGD